MTEDRRAIARELFEAREQGRIVAAAPSARGTPFDLDAAYEIEGELVRLRRDQGHLPVGYKVGYANKAVWRALRLDTLAWAHMYDDTVRLAAGDRASLSLARLRSPKIEPEIVFRLRAPIDAGADAAAVLQAAEWIALGFEIIDGPFPDWTFTPADFVAAFGLHAALVVGAPLRIESASIPALVDALARFTVRLEKNGEPVAEGSGRNALRSPALSVAELAAALSRRGGPLRPGELVSSGTLTESQPIAAGETWRAQVDGLDLPPLTMTAAP